MSASCSSNQSAKTFTVFSFCPDTVNTPPTIPTFYEIPFRGKLALVINAIKKAAAIIEEQPDYLHHVNLFIAPEYTFYGHNETLRSRFHSKLEKRAFVNEMIALSKTIDMVIAPGTFLWESTNKVGNHVYRNTLYMFYQGEVKVCRKKYPHIDYDHEFGPIDGFLEGHYAFMREYADAPKSYFQHKPDDTGIIEMADITFGVEICYDTVRERLRRTLQRTGKEIDVHLLLSSGINHGDERFPKQERAYLAVHIDRVFPGSKTSRGTSIRMIPRTESHPLRCHYVYNGHALTRSYLFDSLYKGSDLPFFQGPITILSNYPPKPLELKGEKFDPVLAHLKSDSYADAQTAAHELLAADYTLDDLNQLYEVYSSQDIPFEAFQTVLALPKEQQNITVLTEFYLLLLFNWLRREKIDRTTKDAFIKTFCYALAKKGLQKIALQIAHYIYSPLLRTEVREKLQQSVDEPKEGQPS
jgi:hypothetical protein